VTAADNGAASAPLSAAQPSVRIEGVTKRFGAFTAVDDVSLDIQEGEIFCLLGGSGCGKTTLLRMLAGFEQPSAGRILIDGQDMADVAPYERPVNMMFQSYALFPHMTVQDNVAFGLEQEKLPKAQIAQRVEAMLSLVRLDGMAQRKPHQLSGGQRQRVALARSLVKRPRLLLLDEPLGALDRKLREHTQFELLGLQKQLGVTFVVVTHDQEEAMTLANRIGVMDRGRIVQVGSPRDIYEYPSTRFVADFIGSVNLFEGRLTEDEADYVRVACPELPAPVLVDHGVSAAPEATVWVAIRPEKIQLLRERPAGTDNHAQGTVRDVAYMGDMSIYLVVLPGGRELRVTRANLQRKEEEAFDSGDAVWLAWDAASPVVGTG
jgi:putrescine transport system ATP-binding protein